MHLKVYLILAHTKPEQVEELIRLLQDGKSLFFIHLDKKVSPTGFQNCKKLAATRFIKKNIKCTWGKFSLVQAALNGFSEIYTHMRKEHPGIGYHTILLSGEDLPLRPNEDIHTFLESKPRQSFIHHWQLPHSYWWNGGMFRFESLYVWGHQKHKKINYWLNRFLRKCGFEFLFPVNRFESKYPGIGYFGGSQWMVLSSGLMKHFLDATRKNKKFAGLFRYVLAPDELYFPMLLHQFLKAELSEVMNQPTHLVVFQGQDANPKYLDVSDIEKATCANYLFARKFDQSKNKAAINYLLKRLGV